MAPKKFRQLIILNLIIIIANIAIFSKAFLGLSLLTGSVLSMSLAWFTLIGSVGLFSYGNMSLLKKPESHQLIAAKVNNLDDCVAVFEEAIKNGDVFDKDILKNLEQIRRFKRKQRTIKDMLLQKFAINELTYQKFSNVLNEVENVIYMNMRSVLNRIAAFDIEEYESLQKRGFPPNEVSDEKMQIYNEFINFVKNATKTNENILLKLDKLLLEISKYNSVDGGEIDNLPAIREMDELIKNAKLYK